MQKRKVDGLALYYLENPAGQLIYTIKVELFDTVDKEKLAKAVVAALDRHSVFKVKLKKGFSTYHYVENSAIFSIQNRESILNEIDFEKNNDFLFNVSYHENVINFDFFHALTDGAGAKRFLSTVMEQYAGFSHSVQDETAEESENAYHRHFKSARIITNISPSSSFNFEVNSDFHVVSFRYNVKDAISLAKANQCSLTELIVGAFAYATVKTHWEILAGKTISISVPVDLRRFYPSNTNNNFTSAFNCDIVVNGNLDSLAKCIEMTKAQFEEKTGKKHIRRIKKWANTLEELPLKPLPLIVKRFLIKASGTGFAPTSNFSNLGIFDRENKLADTVKHIDFILPCSDSLLINFAACTYGGSLNLNFSTVHRNDDFFELINQILLGRLV